MQSSTPPSGSAPPSGRWARLWGWLSGWWSRSPQPASEPSSGTLPGDEEPAFEVPTPVTESIAWLDQVACGLVDGTVRSVVAFAPDLGQRAIMWKIDDGADKEQLALAIMAYGQNLYNTVVRAQGTAPPQNRSRNVH